MLLSDNHVAYITSVLLEKLANGCSEFTLETLFYWTVQSKEVTFKQFRSQLYQSDLNGRLHQMGYAITIKKSTGKVNTSVYQFSKL